MYDHWGMYIAEPLISMLLNCWYVNKIITETKDWVIVWISIDLLNNIFSYGYGTITRKGQQNLSLCLALKTFEHAGSISYGTYCTGLRFLVSSGEQNYLADWYNKHWIIRTYSSPSLQRSKNKYFWASTIWYTCKIDMSSQKLPRQANKSET